MRPLSAGFLEAIAGEATDEVVLVLLTIEHEDLATPIRVVNDTENLTSNGHTFVAFPFSIVMPWEREDQMPQASVRIDNVAREILGSLRPLTGDVTVTIEAVLASAPDDVEYGPFELTLRSAPYDVAMIDGVLGTPPLLDEPCPADIFDPQNWPGLHP